MDDLIADRSTEGGSAGVSSIRVASAESADAEASSAEALETAADRATGVAPEDFEIVLGRRQVASVLFVATVMIAVMCAVSYLAGKSLSPKKAEAPPVAGAVTASVPVIPMIEAIVEPDIAAAQRASQAAAEPASQATAQAKASQLSRPEPAPSTPIGGSDPAAAYSDSAPIFADPRPGATYLQMGAVDKGVATIFAEGLRRRGFESFVAPGVSERMYRVLIGPLADPAAYSRTKQELEQIGLATFGRKYEK
jgi:cell division septation protein DedD